MAATRAARENTRSKSGTIFEDTHATGLRHHAGMCLFTPDFTQTIDDAAIHPLDSLFLTTGIVSAQNMQ
jgi:hypothetical protein